MYFSQYYCISDVGIIDERYLAVSEDVTLYGTEGPNECCRDQYLFDLKTGDELTFSSFYKGSEDDLKKLIATKTREFFKEYSDKNDAEFSEADLNAAYENTIKSVDLSTVRLKEQGASFFLHYHSYDKAPYKDEYYDGLDDDMYEIFISYEELLGRSTLSE
jgi:hypothetical protein